MHRRQLVTAIATTLGLGPLVVWFARPSAGKASAGSPAAASFPVQKSDDGWRERLTTQQYRILRGHGTERPFSSSLNDEKRAGVFNCAGCAQPLFDAATKFESGTGWPSFFRPLDGAIGTSVDQSLFTVRTEVHCARCGGHLGHVFSDGPAPTGLRYCINGAALAFKAA
jgi:peptide-methionine (R)-S-oxide reductase